VLPRRAARAGGWLRESRGGLLGIALIAGIGSGLGAVAFRYLIYLFTWLATGYAQFGQDGHSGSSHLPWLGLAFFVVIPAVGGLVYGPLIYRYAREARGHGVPEVMMAVAERGGRIAGSYVLWFLLVLAAGKMLACSLILNIGGSGGVFAPSLFIGVTSGMAFGENAARAFGPAARPPTLYAVVAMGAVFTAAARAPRTSVASVVEMPGDYALTLPVMLAVAIAAASRTLSYGTLYATKLLRRGTDVDRATPWRAFSNLKAADAMCLYLVPLAVSRAGGTRRPAVPNRWPAVDGTDGRPWMGR
jgi:H+/Cl- antiporter ClcA